MKWPAYPNHHSTDMRVILFWLFLHSHCCWTGKLYLDVNLLILPAKHPFIIFLYLILLKIISRVLLKLLFHIYALYKGKVDILQFTSCNFILHVFLCILLFFVLSQQYTEILVYIEYMNVKILMKYYQECYEFYCFLT